MKKPDKADRILAAARKRDALDNAITVLTRSRVSVENSRIAIGPGYARNRMACVVVEINAALKGLRRERGSAARAIATIARSKV